MFRLTATIITAAQFLGAPSLAAPTCADLRQIYELLETSTSAHVGLSVATATDVAIGGANGALNDPALEYITPNITEPLIAAADNAIARMRRATEIVETACP